MPSTSSVMTHRLSVRRRDVRPSDLSPSLSPVVMAGLAGVRRSGTSRIQSTSPGWRHDARGERPGPDRGGNGVRRTTSTGESAKNLMFLKSRYQWHFHHSLSTRGRHRSRGTNRYGSDPVGHHPAAQAPPTRRRTNGGPKPIPEVSPMSRSQVGDPHGPGWELPCTDRSMSSDDHSISSNKPSAHIDNISRSMTLYLSMNCRHQRPTHY